MVGVMVSLEIPNFVWTWVCAECQVACEGTYAAQKKIGTNSVNKEKRIEMEYGGNLKGTAAILFPMGLRWGAFTDLIFFSQN